MSNENPNWVLMKKLAEGKPTKILKMSLEELDFRIEIMRLHKDKTESEQADLKALIWSRVAVLEILEVREPQFTHNYYEARVAEWSKVAE